MKKYLNSLLLIAVLLGLIIFVSACDNNSSKTQAESNEETNNEETSEEEEKEVYEADAEEEQVELINNITLSEERGNIDDEIEFSIDQLEADANVQLIWMSAEGEWNIEDQYVVVGPEYSETESVIAEGTANADGEWEGSFNIPEGFGGDHTIYVVSDESKVGQANFTVDPTFVMEPKSGPVGTEVTVKVEGIGHSTYMRNWQLSYDNQYTGLISAVSTDGSAEAKFRASGNVGDHIISIRTGYLGSPYINYKQSPYPDKPAPDLTFTVTDEEADIENYVEDVPNITNDGVEMPELKKQEDVEVSLNQEEGTVGETVNMEASGLPGDENIDIVWNTMKGSRVSGLGFQEENNVLDTVASDSDGNLNYDFEVPDDLGGIPHRIDLKSGDEVIGQTYLRILPQIVSMEPKSGPVGTPIEITINGGGWTEFDNAYYLTYDNAYNGYMCSFNSQGNLTFTIMATGEPGNHLIDLYPGVYRQEEKETDMTLIPQLTYATDHPGSAMPAIRMNFEVTE